MKQVILMAALVGVAACGGDEPGRLPIAREATRVTVSEARRAPTAETFPALVEAQRTAEIATRMSGTVERVRVNVGARVHQGDALIELDARDVEAGVRAAQAQAELAQRSFDRVQALAADGAASQQELDQATAALEAARAQRSSAEAQRAYAVVRAPFDGVVTRRAVDPGDLAVPGMPFLTVVAPGALKITADLPASWTGFVRVGERVRVRTEGAVHDAEVTRVVPALGPGSRTFRVEAAFSGRPSALVPGSYARLELTREGEGPRWVPADAVVARGQLTGVYAVDRDTLRLRWVRLGQRRGDAVELLAGPSGALTVVRSPAAELADGQPVSGTTSAPWDGPVSGEAAAAIDRGEVNR